MPGLKTGMEFRGLGLGFGEPGGTPPPIIPRSRPPTPPLGVKPIHLPSLKAICLEISKIIALQSRRILQMFVWWGPSLCPPPYNRL